MHLTESWEDGVVAAPPSSWNGDIAVILAHGAGQGMDSPFMSHFHGELAMQGLLTVKFNFEYMNRGRRLPDPMPRLEERYRQVIRVVERRGPRRLFIGGKSMGGRVASYLAGTNGSIAGAVFLGYPLHPAGKPEAMRDAHLYGVNRPMLFVSGTRDNMADAGRLKAVIERIGPEATIEWIDGGDHSLMVRRNDRSPWDRAASVVAAWCLRTGGSSGVS